MTKDCGTVWQPLSAKSSPRVAIQFRFITEHPVDSPNKANCDGTDLGIGLNLCNDKAFATNSGYSDYIDCLGAHFKFTYSI